ncbi:GRF1-interacting factor 1-like isoform X1 [Ananas comosus]|uniref:GRF1-interacting factor 1-like isoform X1 n=1 Tax=Ananas comosus TaxID=4615 RepID=A0A6P5EU26_ANACO|nr:GRF1-interacting factor 1-like isoform X1 [Ananas comosus]
MQQHLMQMNQNMMGGYASPTTVTTDLIQQYLDENKQLILAILDNQNTGKVEECARNQAKLQHNLMYLAAIADSQPPQASAMAQQYPSNLAMQSGLRYMPAQPAQLMSPPQSLMAARSSMLYAQPALSPIQHGMGSNVTSGFNLLHGEGSMGGTNTTNSGMLNTGVFSDLGRGAGAGKQDGGAGSGGQGGEGGEPMYLKGSEEEGS